MTCSTRTTIAAWTSGSLASGATVARYRSVSWIWPLAQVDSTDSGASRAAIATSRPATTGRHQPRRSTRLVGSFAAFRRATSSRSLATSSAVGSRDVAPRGQSWSWFTVPGDRCRWRHPWRVTRRACEAQGDVLSALPVDESRSPCREPPTRSAPREGTPRHAGGLRGGQRVHRPCRHHDPCRARRRGRAARTARRPRRGGFLLVDVRREAFDTWRTTPSADEFPPEDASGTG